MKECNKICKMQAASLRVLIESLRNVSRERAARYMLRDAIKMLEDYNCDTGKALIARMKTCMEGIYDQNWTLNVADRNSINMLIAEIEMFIN